MKKLLLIALVAAGCGVKETKETKETKCRVIQRVNLFMGKYQVYTANHVHCRYSFFSFTVCEKNEIDSVKKADYAWGESINATLDSLNPTH